MACLYAYSDNSDTIKAYPSDMQYPKVVLLWSSITTSPKQSLNQKRMHDLLLLKKIRFELCDGSQDENRKYRNQFWAISKERGKYPQIFVIENENNAKFIGDADTIQEHIDYGEFDDLFAGTFKNCLSQKKQRKHNYTGQHQYQQDRGYQHQRNQKVNESKQTFSICAQEHDEKINGAQQADMTGKQPKNQFQNMNNANRLKMTQIDNRHVDQLFARAVKNNPPGNNHSRIRKHMIDKNQYHAYSHKELPQLLTSIKGNTDADDVNHTTILTNDQSD